MKQMYRYTFEGVNSETGEVNQSLDEIEINGLPDQNHIQYSKGFYIILFEDVTNRNMAKQAPLTNQNSSKVAHFNWKTKCI